MNLIGCIIMGVVLNIIPILCLMFCPVQWDWFKVYCLGWGVNLILIGIYTLIRHFINRF